MTDAPELLIRATLNQQAYDPRSGMTGVVIRWDNNNRAMHFSVPNTAIAPARPDDATERARLEGENARLREALTECEDYFDNRADAEYFTDSATPAANKEMHMLTLVREALGARTIEHSSIVALCRWCFMRREAADCYDPHCPNGGPAP